MNLIENVEAVIRLKLHSIEQWNISFDEVVAYKYYPLLHRLILFGAHMWSVVIVAVVAFPILRMHLSKTVFTCKSIFECVVFKLPTHSPDFNIYPFRCVETKRELTDTIFRRYHQISMQSHKPQIYCCLLCVQRWRLFIVIVFPHIDHNLNEGQRLWKRKNATTTTNERTSRIQTKGEKAHIHALHTLIQHRIRLSHWIR